MPVASRKATSLLVLLIAIGFLSYISFNTYVGRQYIGVPLQAEHQQVPEPDNEPARIPRILLVSALFPLEKSKHSAYEYAIWLRRFLHPITTDVYFFTTPDMESTVLASRGSALGRITVNTSFASPFAIPPLAGLEAKYAYMHTQDRERFRHTPELYAVWNSKPFFLDEAMRNVAAGDGASPGYDYAFWCDAGSFRGPHQYMAWPDVERVREMWRRGSWKSGTPEGELLFFPIAAPPPSSVRKWREEMGPVDYDISEGSFFGGSPQTVAWWRRLFYAYHDHYLSKGMFVGKDQTLINALFLLAPKRIITVWRDDPTVRVPGQPRGDCGPEWFYYQYWLAGDWEREEMRRVWAVGATWWKFWQRGECQATDVLALEDVLRRQFGDGWVPPNATVLIH